MIREEFYLILENAMKTKVGTLIDAELLKEVKRAAAEDGKRLCDLFAEALAGYLADRAPEPRRAMHAYRRFCNNPIGGVGASMDDLREIVDDDLLAQ